MVGGNSYVTPLHVSHGMINILPDNLCKSNEADGCLIDKITIYPNPSINSFTIVTPIELVGQTITIYNDMGGLEFKEKVESSLININHSSFSTKGLKLLKVGERFIEKIILK